jgi:hypothetical protein
MDHAVTTGELCRSLGVSRETLSKFAKRGVIEKGSKRGTWMLQPSVSGYVRHLREEAAARGGQAAVPLGSQ